MQLNKTKSADGYLWIRQGLWLFKKNPLTFLMLVFLYIFIAQFAILIPVFGVFLVLLLTKSKVLVLDLALEQMQILTNIGLFVVTLDLVPRI